MFRRDHNNLPSCLFDFWRRNIDVSGREGRLAENFFQETINFNYLDKHPYFYYPKLYNDLPDIIKSSESEKVFNKLTKIKLLDSLE